MTPELALILACCRWPDGAARRHAIAVVAEQVGDWAAVAALARAHRVEGLVDNGLRSGAIDTPERCRAQLAAAAAEIRAFNFGAIAQTLRIDRALGNAGIPAMFLKGLPVGVAAYGTPLLKRSWDIDLFVRPADATAAGTILEGLGYAPRRPPRPLDGAEFARWSVVSKEAEFRAATGITVELHWRLADHPMLIPTIDATAPSRAVTLLGEHRVATLADAPNLAYLAVHGAMHGWSRLKWLADFAALLASRPCAERAQICAQARWWQPGIALDLALSLSNRLLGLEVEDSRPPSVLIPLALTVIEETAAGREPGDNPRARRAIRALQWRLMPGVRYAALESLRRLRGSEDRLAVALPGGLHWLYWPLRLPLGLMRIVRRRLARAVPQSPE